MPRCVSHSDGAVDRTADLLRHRAGHRVLGHIAARHTPRTSVTHRRKEARVACRIVAMRARAAARGAQDVKLAQGAKLRGDGAAKLIAGEI